MDGIEFVTMIFMGYQQVEDNEEEKKRLTGYDGVIYVELVVIDDEEEESEGEVEKLFYYFIVFYSQVYQFVKLILFFRKRSEVNFYENINYKFFYKNFIFLKE